MTEPTTVGTVTQLRGEWLLSAEEIVAGYLPGVDILKGCSLDLYRGELIVIIGPNGAGKSTLLKAMFGLVAIRSGTVTLRGVDITNRTAHELVALGVGYVPQSRNVFRRLTVEENLEVGLYLEPELWDDRFRFVADLFPLLADRRKQRAGSLSGGERQMLALGRALMMNPEILLLDEPSAGLSPDNQDILFQWVEELIELGISIVMVEHNTRRCLEIADRGYVLDDGGNAYTGPGKDLLLDPKVNEIWALMRSPWERSP
jgi:branched-chain amino acid transport system ATP-binding protein